jgi:hypothetical protein
MKHSYADQLTLTSTTGSLQTYQFSCNGMYDPDITSTGHQPLYFDQLTAIYDHYTVFEARIVVEIVTNQVARAVLYIDDDTSTAPNMGTASEQPSATAKLIPATTVKPIVFTKRWNAKEFFGGNIYDNDDLQGSASANPVEQSYFTLLLKPADPVGDCTYQLRVMIHYLAVWDELKTMAQS